MNGKIAAWLCAAAIAAPVPALGAEAAAPDLPCNQLLSDNADLRLGDLTGSGPLAFLRDGPNCPGPGAACRSKVFARPGHTLLLGQSRPDYVCAFDARTGMTGWLPQQRVAARPIDAAPLMADWIGTWQLSDTRIVLKREGDGIGAEGEAYWPGKNIMPANEGTFSGTAKPAGNRLHFAGEPQDCTVDLTLAGPFLVVADNRECGGHNVSFTGIYTRRRARAP